VRTKNGHNKNICLLNIVFAGLERQKDIKKHFILAQRNSEKSRLWIFLKDKRYAFVLTKSHDKRMNRNPKQKSFNRII